ncbi:bacterioferritin-associated ferredoxin [Streptomyces ovatisporus]|uniref:Bacterioferritin-associated ferredoxin n=1 Tax=Streptomyces ovatisporus TaxID=1128682 RepID=A0ABV9AEV5_9ACTN
MYVCSCFGITERQVREHAEAGACTPRQIASASKAGTDCGSCVRRIQGLLGRGGCPRRQLEGAGAAPVAASAAITADTYRAQEETAGVAEAA